MRVVLSLFTSLILGSTVAGQSLRGAAAQMAPPDLPADCATVLEPAHRPGAAPQRDPTAGEPLLTDRDLTYVPLTFHVVRRSDGTGGIPFNQLCQALDDLNLLLFPGTIEFYVQPPIDYIDSDLFYEQIDSMQEIDMLRSTNVVADTINVYFTPHLSMGSGEFCGISSFTWSPVQGVVMHNTCTGRPWNPTTFPHEIGHYFDLLHTHETAYGHECVDGSNCTTAGDLLCDTPADPGLNDGNVDANCEYIGNETDPCHGDPYNADPANLMSSADVLCREYVTPGGLERAVSTLFDLRPELVHDAVPVEADCNANGEADFCDIYSGVSEDENGNGIPDECEENCAADLNGDRSVNVLDLLAMLDAWGPCADCSEDLDHNGSVNVVDLLLLLEAWGPCD
jgi:hypothetical protein